MPEPADQDGDGWNDIVATEFEKEVDTFCEDGDKLVLASLSCSPCPPRGFIELSPHLNNCQSQSHRRSEERRDASRSIIHTVDIGTKKPLRQDAEVATKEPRKQQEQGEVEEETTVVVEIKKVQ
jgi:hypothetical protein